MKTKSLKMACISISIYIYKYPLSSVNIQVISRFLGYARARLLFKTSQHNWMLQVIITKMSFEYINKDCHGIIICPGLNNLSETNFIFCFLF